MKIQVVLLAIVSVICFLTGCQNSSTIPDLQNIQPTPQQVNQEKLNKALQS